MITAGHPGIIARPARTRALKPAGPGRASAWHAGGMRDYPRAQPRVDQVEPAPRRVRAIKDGVVVLDSTSARYVFEWAFYPQFYIPRADVRAELIATDETEDSSRGQMRWHDLGTGSAQTPRAARVLVEAKNPLLTDTVRFEWDLIDQWFEEDEEIFVHPRNPYVRVDALRSTRRVRIEIDGTVLAESSAPVLVFETGLPTRYYLDKSAVRWEHLVENGVRTACPYKGRTTGYWSAHVAGRDVADVAWCYEFPTRQLLPIAGLVGFLNERVDLFVDGVLLPPPGTHFS
jgi:uncharacterized protein (DUF427 family)